MRLVQLDPARPWQDATHLLLEVGPLLGAVEILEDGKAAFLEVGAKRRRFRVAHDPETGLPHECNGMLEQFGIVEREDAAAVHSYVEIRELADDLRQVLLSARVVVVPGRTPEP